MVGQTQEHTHSAQARLLHANAAKPLASTGYWRTRFMSLPVFFPTDFVAQSCRRIEPHITVCITRFLRCFTRYQVEKDYLA